MRNCPICLSKKLELKEIIPLSAYENYPINGPYILTRCMDCSFYFHNTNIVQNDLDEYYINLSKYENAATVSIGSGGLTDLDKKRLHSTFDNIQRYINNKNVKILDIGCAAGGLLGIFKSNGYEFVYGSDPSHYCSEVVRTNLNCTVYEGSFLSVDIKEKFDVIILTHVLEHILDVRAFIEKISSLLTIEGVMYIECPDSTHYHSVIHAPYQEFNTEHINHFSPSDYENLSRQLKLEVIDSGYIQFTMETSDDYYANWAIIKSQKNVKSKPFITNNDRKESISQYISLSQTMLVAFNHFFTNTQYNKIALVGIGQLSFKLIPILKKLNIEIELYDNDSRNWGKKIGHLTVMAGDELVNLPKENGFAILISSMISFNAIKEGLIKLFISNKQQCPEILSCKNIFLNTYESI